MGYQAAVASLVALGVLLAVTMRHGGAVSLGQVVDICPGCATGDASAANLGERVAARAPRSSDAAGLSQGRAQQLSSLPAGEAPMGAPTQMLPYRVSGDVTVPQASALTSPIQQVANPDLTIRFAQSHLEQPGVIPPVVPREIYDDAQSTKRMAAHLKAVLKQQTTISGDMKAKVNKLRAFISHETESVVDEADAMDATDSKLISKRPRERGIPGQRGIDGTPGKPGMPGGPGANGRTGNTGRDGRRGVRGPLGSPGPAGRAGTNGPQGVRGPQGPRGPVGGRGAVGGPGIEPGSVWFQSQMNPSLSSFNPALCPDGDNGMVRLAGCTHRSCKLEVLHEKHWGSVCDDGFGGENARVVCQSLGYSGHRAAALRQLTGGSGKIWLDDVKCKGNEESITLCHHNGWGFHDCSHQKDVGVCCQRLQRK